MRLCLKRSRAATNWRQYANWDNRLHRVIAESTQNNLLLALLDPLHAVRRPVDWGRLRATKVKPDPNPHSFAEHDPLRDACTHPDLERALQCWRRPLEKFEL